VARFACCDFATCFLSSILKNYWKDLGHDDMG
jgi:hypothetical protein